MRSRPGRPWRWQLWLLALLATSVCGCVGAPGPSTTGRPLRLVLNGLAGGQQAGILYGRALGYYAAEGIDVQVDESRGSTDAVARVATGRGDVAVADALAIVRARAAGATVTAVSTLFQVPRYTLLSRPDQPVRQPGDLRGKQIGLSPAPASADDLGRALLATLLANNGLDDVTIVELPQAELVPSLRSGRVAAIVGRTDFEALQFQRLSEAVVATSFAELGLDAAGLSLAVRDDLIQRDPAVVAGVVRASLRGWAAARQDPAHAARAVVEQFLAGMDEDVAGPLEADLAALCGPHNAVLGLPVAASWNVTEQVAGALGPPQPAVEAVVTDRFMPADAPPCPG